MTFVSTCAPNISHIWALQGPIKGHELHFHNWAICDLIFNEMMLEWHIRTYMLTSWLICRAQNVPNVAQRVQKSGQSRLKIAFWPHKLVHMAYFGLEAVDQGLNSFVGIWTYKEGPSGPICLAIRLLLAQLLAFMGPNLGHLPLQCCVNFVSICSTKKSCMDAYLP